MKKCNVCGNTTFHDERVDEIFHLDGRTAKVEGIPARVCDRCGDATFDRETVERVRHTIHGTGKPMRQEQMDVYAFVGDCAPV